MIALTRQTMKKCSVSSLSKAKKMDTKESTFVQFKLPIKDQVRLKKLYRVTTTATALNLAVIDFLEILEGYGNKHPAVILDKLRQTPLFPEQLEKTA